MTRKEADQVIDRLQSNWPKEPMPAATRATYLLAIADLDYGLANAATLQAIATRTWFPKPAELRQIAAELVQAADGKPSAEEAWDEFYKAARTYGYYQVPQWSHPAVEATARTIGYREYCLSDESEVTIWRAQFLKAYSAHADRATRQMQMLPQVKQLVESLRMDRPRQPAALPEATQTTHTSTTSARRGAVDAPATDEPGMADANNRTADAVDVEVGIR